MTQDAKTVEELSINTVRMLAMDAIQAANSGHPGAPIALAPLAYTLYAKYLRVHPANPDFANRDRFVLSNGHASMLLYASLHLSGYDLSLDDLKDFRQLESKTPGHPEYGCAPGVETTTGPLGQGAANSVGMAMAGKWLAAHFNRPGHALFDYRVYSVLGDGCMMEGLTAEAASLAGHLRLDNLIWFYDSNHITIEGATELTYSDNVAGRFEAYGWHVQAIDDIDNRPALGKSIDAALAEHGRPSLIVVPSIIGRGAPTRQNTAKAHGEPLGAEEIRGAKKFYGWDEAATFHIPNEVRSHWTEPSRKRGEALEAEWRDRFAVYAKAFPAEAREWGLIEARQLPDGWDQDLPSFDADKKGLATRASGGKTLVALGRRIGWLIGGSADLAPSTKTLLEDTSDFSASDYAGRNLRFGIREHAMAAICNGLALSKLRPYAASFLVFSDYARPAIRISALMGQPVIYVFTHDSIAVGEDGPTHQPVEQIASLRAIPGLDVFRPADANETVMAWRHALRTNDRPVLLALSRQALPTLDRARYADCTGALRGGYVLAGEDDHPEVILIGTGSELQYCVAAHEALKVEGHRSRVVSLPCWELFERQDASYREAVLPTGVRARVGIEAGVAQGWERYVGTDGIMIAQGSFGLSAPCGEVLRHFGVTAEAVAHAARAQLRRTST